VGIRQSVASLPHSGLFLPQGAQFPDVYRMETSIIGCHLPSSALGIALFPPFSPLTKAGTSCKQLLTPLSAVGMSQGEMESHFPLWECGASIQMCPIPTLGKAQNPAREGNLGYPKLLFPYGRVCFNMPMRLLS